MSRNQDRYVILDNLPKFQQGVNKGRIDWAKTVGYSVPFKYDEVSGEIQIVGYSKQQHGNNAHRAILSIIIDKYVTEPINVRSDLIVGCLLYNLVKNKIINKAPHLIQYLANPDDAYKYTYQSNQKIKTKCPICGYEDMSYVSTMYNNGFYCPECSDTSTIPNKMMFNILKQLRINFVPEVNKRHYSWMGRYRYDFYFNLQNQNILIEMDGGFHELESQKHTDNIKTKLAFDNNFKLVRINCNYINTDPFEYIKTNILNSELNKLLELNNIDWDLCRQYTITNIIYEECKMWEEGYSVGEIMSKFAKSKTAVRRHLLRGKTLGLCPSYDKYESWKRSSELRSQPVAFIHDDIIKYVFANSRNASEQSLGLFGVKCSESGIRAVCDGIQTHTHNLRFKHITKEEYEQYKMIENNNTNKEAM